MGVVFLRKKEWKIYLFFILLCEAVGALSALISMVIGGWDAMSLIGVNQSELTPPGFVFPIVWTILYALMGIGVARIWMAEQSKDRTRGLVIFSAQLAVNFLWSIIFFGFQWFQLAFWWILLLWIMIILMIIFYHKTDKIAAWLQVPYLIWVTFASYLTYMVWMIN